MTTAGVLLTVSETAELLRTTPQAIYTMVSRGQLPGVVRLGRRVLVRQKDLCKHLGLDSPPRPAKQTVPNDSPKG
jgi:excisionase family DNA binding protein